jgi:tetratricopeptide (TPR) repeat protein
MKLVLLIVWTAAGALAQDPIGAAIQAIDEGRYDAAVEILTKAAAAAPQDIHAHFNLALAYSLQGKDAEAIPEYRKVLELDPEIYEAHLNLGQVLLRARDASGAIPHLKRAAAAKPDEFRPAYYLGEALAETGQFADAVAPYTSAVAADPNSAPAELGLGRALARLGRRAEAEPHYRKAAALDPQLRSFLLELATFHEQDNELPQAIALYREFPQEPAALERAGLLSFRLERFEDASAALEAVVRLSPTPASRLALAQVYVKQSQLSKAELLLAQLVFSEPRDFDIRMLYARVLRDERKTAEAARQFQEAANLRPEAPQAWSELAGMLILEEQFPQALAALDRVKALGAENAGHMFFRATTLDRLRLRREALEYYQKFLEASKDNPDQEFQARQRIRVLELELGKR